MSFDLEIVTSLKPESSQVEEFFVSRESFAVEGTLDGEGGNVFIAKRSKGHDPSCFTIDGPFRIDPEDVEEEVIAHVLDPHWLTQISVPASAIGAGYARRLESLKAQVSEQHSFRGYRPIVSKDVGRSQRRRLRRFVLLECEEAMLWR